MLLIYITKITNLKAFIPKNYFNEVDITADGNCFFRAVSKYLSGEETYHYILRKLVYNYICLNKNSIKEKNDNSLIYFNNNFSNRDEYLNEIKHEGTFS